MSGRVLGGLLLSVLGWRAISFARFPVSAIATIIAIPEPVHTKSHKETTQLDYRPLAERRVASYFRRDRIAFNCVSEFCCRMDS